MKVTLCVNYTAETGGAQMVTADLDVDWPTVPRIGDEVEVQPGDESRSEWTEPVERIYFYRDGSVELHVRPHVRPSEETIAELRGLGFE